LYIDVVWWYRTELRKTCEWLARFEEFNGHSANQYVEIPGQYSGNVQPLVIIHFHITPLLRGVLLNDVMYCMDDVAGEPRQDC
jgi:hypothetical protein